MIQRLQKMMVPGEKRSLRLNELALIKKQTFLQKYQT